MREDLERRERETLSPFATFSDATRGRVCPRQPDPYRTEFQRDRERIVHCKSFRRLSHKTQVFIAPEGDHFRTRMTHTLEVAQISRSVARRLALNEDLTEAIALGNDLGHTPFGHTGEAALDECLRALAQGEETPGEYVRTSENVPGGYEHVDQSLRVVEYLEYGGKGLNLCWETRDGIHGHSGAHQPATPEGQIVRIADRIAYINHDIDDALRAGVLSGDILPKEPCRVLGDNSNKRITTLVDDLVESSAGRQNIVLSPRVEEALLSLRQFMFATVYESSRAKAEEPKAKAVVKALFNHYIAFPDEVPEEHRSLAGTSVVQAVVDYVAGMTDRYALRLYKQLFLPAGWQL
jgi:dGTPase